MKKVYLGVDVGSVSTNVVIMDEDNNVIDTLYIKTQGRPIQAMKECLETMKNRLDEDVEVMGLGTTGSGRELAAIMLRADIVKMKLQLMELQPYT